MKATIWTDRRQAVSPDISHISREISALRASTRPDALRDRGLLRIILSARQRACHEQSRRVNLEQSANGGGRNFGCNIL